MKLNLKTFLKKYGSLFAGIALGFSLLQGARVLSAQENVNPPPTIQQPPSAENQQINAQCIQQLEPILTQEREKLLKFIDTTFKNKVANTELTDLALAQYKNYRAIAQNKLNSIASQGVEKVNQIDRLSELQACQKRLDSEFSIIEQALRQHVRGTTAAKKTTALLEKLQGINGKLEGLNVRLGEMRGYFQVMANKVPFFVQSCLK